MQKYYFNRELSWLKFNLRVLNESRNTTLPLLERLKFIAIYGINLDEFYMIRIAGLKKLYRQGILKTGIDAMTPKEQLCEIEKTLREQKKILEESYCEIKALLYQEGIAILEYAELNAEQKNQAKEYFFKHLYPIIVPIVVDFTHPFPHLNNLSFGIVVRLEKKNTDKIQKFALVRIPRLIPRFIEISAGVFVLSESIVGEFVNEIFEGYEVRDWCAFRVTRNADFEIEAEEADDFLELLSEGLKARRNGEFVRLQLSRSKDISLLRFLQSHLHLGDEDIFQFDLPLNMGALWQIVSHQGYAHLRCAYYQPKIPKVLQENQDLFEVLNQQDLLLFHPYESFDPIVRLISQASQDPEVLSIKMTLYRVGRDSPIVQALIEAAEHKQVNVLVELKARFDEENNLEWVRALENAGAHVVYGVMGLKVHAKIALVLKQAKEGIKGYVHLSSGNYNLKNAKSYTDVSLLSSKQELVEDAIRFFHFLSAGLAKEGRLKTMMMAPTQIKPKILEMIEKEIWQKGEIIMKMNAIVDRDIIDALYRASNAGVKISLIVRGICSLKPKIKEMSENIRVISIVGKYLEHARIYYFKHSGIFFSSADMMSRNLERRVELLVPIENKQDRNKLFEFLQFQLRDSVGAYELYPNGEYVKIVAEEEFGSQDAFEKLFG